MGREIRGFAFPFRLEGGVLPAPSTTEESIAASLTRIVNTRRGERPMRPDVGSRVWDFVFDGMSTLTAGRIKAEIRGAIAVQEPRVRLLDVRVVENVAKNGYDVDITYALGAEVSRLPLSIEAS